MRFVSIWLLISVMALAEKSSVKVEDIPSTSEETNITIQKGSARKDCTRYEIIDGHEDVFAGPEYDKTKALSNWKAACSEWIKNFREMNKENRVISVNCGQPIMSKEGDQTSYKSTASYKVRVMMQEPIGK
ncbi:MAG: hypothetical protein HYR96_13160 [Deltaproteobacteria bacterium]|nr:hypothetical protein [Deltaproteobacteria bacterium]MBI3295677.1 hypothetical protein [Deltaproteobacteria bacterium]